MTAPTPPVAPGVPPASLAALPTAAVPHYVVLRSAIERQVAERRATAAAFFHAGAAKSAFHHAAAVFLSRDEAAWKLDGAVATGLAST